MLRRFHSPLLRKIIGSMGLKVGAVLVGFNLNVVIARLLGADQAGIYFWFFSAVSLASVVARQGYDRIVVRQHAGSYGSAPQQIPIFQRHVEKRVLINAATIGLALFFAGQFVANSIFHKPEVGLALKWSGVCIVFFALLQNLTEAFKGVERIYTGIFLWGIMYPALVTLSLWALFHSKWRTALVDLAGDHLLAVLSLGISVIITWVVSRIIWLLITRKWSSNGFSKNKVKVDTKERKRLFLVAIMEYSVNFLPTLLMGVFVISSDIALFEASRRTSMLMAFFLVAFNSVLSPRIAALHAKNDLVAINRLSKRSTLLLILFTFPVMMGVLIFPQYVLQLFGGEFVNAGLALILLSFGQFINVICGPVGIILVMGKKDKEKLQATFAGFLVMIVLSLILLPTIGYLGGAISVSMGVIIQNLVSIYFVKKSFGFYPIPHW